MASAGWEAEVARLLGEASEALQNKRHRRVIVALGTAVAYVQRASEQGDKFAQELLRHTVANPKEDATERFTFAPGELEALSVRPSKK